MPLNLNESAQNLDEEDINSQRMLTAKSMDELLMNLVESIKVQPNMSPISEQSRTFKYKRYGNYYKNSAFKRQHDAC